MSTKPELPEVTMAREVKTLYFDTMRNSQEFHQRPFLDRDVFRKHFATVAHQHGIFHKESPEGRDQYNLYFGLIWNRLRKAVRLLAKNEEQHHPPIQPAKPRQEPPQPRRSEPPEQLWLYGLDPKVAEARKRLAVIRDELADRPSIC